MSGMRTQSLATPSLWRDVLILGTSKLYFSFFHRSSPLLVDVAISMPNTMPLEGESSVGAIILGFLAKNFNQEPEIVSRIRSFYLAVQGGGQVAFALDSFDFRRFTNLSSFQVGAVHRLPLGNVQLPQSPNIRVAKLVGLFPESTPLPRTITKLTFASKGAPLSTSTFRQIIYGLPRLETLVLELEFRAHETHTSTEWLTPLCAPSLKHLAIASIVGGTDFAYRSDSKPICLQNDTGILGCLVARRLEYVEVASWGALHHLTNLIGATTWPVTLLLNQAFSPADKDLGLFEKLVSDIHLRVISPPGAQCEECLDFYLARADGFSSTVLYSTDGHRVEEYGGHVFMPPRMALEPLVLHPQECVLNHPPTAVHALPDPIMPYLYLDPVGKKRELKGRRSPDGEERTRRYHHRDNDVDTLGISGSPHPSQSSDCSLPLGLRSGGSANPPSTTHWIARTSWIASPKS